MRVPSDEALQKFLSSVESKVPPHTILLDETFARKLLLGSMQVRGREKSLRPDWERNLEIDNSDSGETSRPEFVDQNIIYISDQVLAVTHEDLMEAIRGLSVRELSRGITSRRRYSYYLPTSSRGLSDKQRQITTLIGS